MVCLPQRCRHHQVETSGLLAGTRFWHKRYQRKRSPEGRWSACPSGAGTTRWKRLVAHTPGTVHGVWPDTGPDACGERLLPIPISASHRNGVGLVSTSLMALDDYLLEAEDKMMKTEHVVVNEFAGVRTGKASPALVENIVVEVYGSQMRIRELAGITTPEPRTLTIQPWDVNSLHPIEKAIQKANLGLSPSIQGKAIRLFFPELSQERRQEFAKIIRKMAEDGRVAIRHVRRDTMDQIKKHGHDSGVTEDDGKHAEKELQKLTDDYIAKIDAHLAHKEKEIMTV